MLKTHPCKLRGQLISETIPDDIGLAKPFGFGPPRKSTSICPTFKIYQRELSVVKSISD